MKAKLVSTLTWRSSEKAVFTPVEKSGNYEKPEYQRQSDFIEQDITPWKREYAQVSQIKLMPKFFTKKSEVDACVE